MPEHPDPEFRIEFRSRGLHVFCENCPDTKADTEYMGLDPAFPQFKLTCPKCLKSGTYKMYTHHYGFPEKPTDSAQ